MVIDSLTEAPIEGARISALDETGAPVTDVALSDVEGRYVLAVPAARDASGELVDALKWTLFATAIDYQPFPAGIRPAIPVNAADATFVEENAEEGDGDGERVLSVVENASTTIALIELADADKGGVTVSGTVGGEAPEGTLVVAEGGATAPYTLADTAGAFALFNVKVGSIAVVGYRRGLQVEPAAVTVADADVADVHLGVVTEDSEAMPQVGGTINLVNADGSPPTSVVLVPSSVFNDILERGPVPFGLRAPDPPLAPSITGEFAIVGVPNGTYKVLAAFENDGLVRDPDTAIAGTQIQEITVSNADVQVEESFKVTSDLAVIGPGADAPEAVTEAPDLVFADDAGEESYTVVVFDALGNLVWETDLTKVTGSPEVVVPYEGPLEPGMYYQFRATSFKLGGAPISRTEDLRGVFVVESSAN
jgi:hypothetical protein